MKEKQNKQLVNNLQFKLLKLSRKSKLFFKYRKHQNYLKSNADNKQMR